jgi:hypothetical protein
MLIFMIQPLYTRETISRYILYERLSGLRGDLDDAEKRKISAPAGIQNQIPWPSFP